MPRGWPSDRPLAGHPGTVAIPPRPGGDESAILAARHGMMTALDLVRQAAILTDGAAMVASANDAARGLIGNGILLTHGRLCAGTRPADAALHELVLRTMSIEAGLGVAGLVALSRWPGRPLIVRAAALAATSFGKARILVTLNGLDAPADLAIAPLARALGLTAAETRLARQLAGGQGLACAAAALGISISTVRTHLKAIFAKTDTHSQAELASLFARGVGFERE